MDQENGRWITSNGAHIFIENGQTKTEAFDELNKQNNSKSPVLSSNPLRYFKGDYLDSLRRVIIKEQPSNIDELKKVYSEYCKKHYISEDEREFEKMSKEFGITKNGEKFNKRFEEFDYKTEKFDGGEVFDRNTTGSGAYSEMLDKKNLDYFRNEKGINPEIVMMTPNEYFDETARIFNTTRYADKESTKNDNVDTIDYLQWIVNNKNKKLPLPYIDNDKNTQDGRLLVEDGSHRLVALKNAGYKKVEVMMRRVKE